MIPVVWLSVKQTGFPIPQLIYGQQLVKVTELEKKINADPGEQQVRQIFKDRSAAATEKLKDPAASFAADKAAVDGKVAELKAAKADDAAIAAAEAAAGKFPADVAAYTAGLNREKGLAARANPPRNHADAFPGKDEKAKDVARKNFLALVLCLMVGTAALPHILMRFYTTPSVREARNSVTWSLFFIFLLYFTAPALAVLVKFVMYNDIVGSQFAALPEWVARWNAVDATLLAITDVNKDGIVQLAEVAHQTVLGVGIALEVAPEPALAQPSKPVMLEAYVYVLQVCRLPYLSGLAPTVQPLSYSFSN
jgi:cation/acetate symporter